MAAKKSSSKRSARKQKASAEAVSYDEFRDVRGTALHRHEDRSRALVELRRRALEGKEDHADVEKLNANDYTTSLAGLKFKIAHRRADSEKWSATPKTQRKRMIRFRAM